MIKQGYVWHYIAYSKDEPSYQSTEAAARERKEGLWKQDTPLPPWEWRRAHKQTQKQAITP